MTFHVEPEGKEELLKGLSRSVTGPNVFFGKTALAAVQRMEGSREETQTQTKTSWGGRMRVGLEVLLGGI